MSAIPAIIADIRRSRQNEKWVEDFSLEICLRGGTTEIYQFVAIKAGYLVVNDSSKPRGFDTTYFPFEAILSVRPVWQ